MRRGTTEKDGPEWDKTMDPTNLLEGLIQTAENDTLWYTVTVCYGKSPL
jgi:hypothetical protein